MRINIRESQKKNKLKYGAYIIVVLLLSCKNDAVKTIPSQSNLKQISIEPRIDSILKEYLVINNAKGKLNEIYFDRVYAHYTIITIGCREKRSGYLEHQYPMLFTVLNQDTVWIYTGLENYVKNRDNTVKFNYYNDGFESIWNVIDSNGVISIRKEGGLPFLPLPERWGSR